MTRSIWNLRVGLSCVVLLGCVVVASGATITVSWDGTAQYTTIQAGIDAAITGDEVVVSNGTYTGVGNRDLDFNGKTITVRSANGFLYTTIDCENAARAFYFHTNETNVAVVEGFTLTNGSADLGGSIFCSGPVWGTGTGSPTVRQCRFVNNNASIGGGAVFCVGNNVAVFEACTFKGNSSNQGGGMQCHLGNAASVIGCTFEANTVTTHGGGLFCYGSSPTIRDTVFIDNIASVNGGGCSFRDGGSASVVNCMMVGNSAYRGGGISASEASPAVTNCLLTDNSADYGGGYNCEDATGSIANTIIWGNSSSQGVAIAVSGTGSLLSVSHSDVEGGQTGIYYEAGATAANVSWLTGNLDTWPIFLSAATGDYRLDYLSPCIDAGDDAAVPGGVTTDLAGASRFVGTVDMGPYEMDTLTNSDGDALPDYQDNCPLIANTDQVDSDEDGVGDVCDACADTPTGAAVDETGCALQPGDFDGDRDVDMEDFAHLQVCLSGFDVAQVDPLCQDANLDGDVFGDVDTDDVDVFLQCVTGANVPGDPFCAD